MFECLGVLNFDLENERLGLGGCGFSFGKFGYFEGVSNFLVTESGRIFSILANRTCSRAFFSYRLVLWLASTSNILVFIDFSLLSR